MHDPEDDTDWPDGDAGAEAPGGRNLPAVRQALTPEALRLARSAWNPEPVEPPQIDRELPSLSWPERAAEALRYAALAAEHWVSRRGVLREWLRLNLWVGIALLAFALLVVPPVTMLLEGTAEWSELVKATALNVTATIAGLPPVVIAIATALVAYKLLRRNWLRRRSRGRYHDHGDPYGMQ